MERMEALTNYYTTHNEDARLAPKRGMVEFLTSIHYVEKYLKPGMVGATAHMLDIFRKE